MAILIAKLDLNQLIAYNQLYAEYNEISKNTQQIISTPILFVLYWQPTFHLLIASVVDYIKYLGRLYHYSSHCSNRDTLYFGKQSSLFYTRILYYQYLLNYMLVGPLPVYKYSLLYIFLFSFLLLYKSWRCFNTPPQFPLRDLLVNIAIQTALDEETGERKDRKDRGASSRYQLSNVNSYIIAA